ncbi:MAG: polysaccharide biosynthesis protein [Lachnospiraceae bacterium]|nr:polysaccharide biosynthesis protein [Lachnospiraceae bacterium]
MLKIPLIRIILLIVSDLFAILLATVLPLYVRYDFHFLEIPQEYWYTAIGAYFPNVILTLIIFHIFHLYNSVWRYASDTELINNLIAVVLCTLMQPVLFWLEEIRMPVSYTLFYGFFLIVFTCGARFSYRILRAIQNNRRNSAIIRKPIRCMIVGGGAAGNAIMKEIEVSRYLNKRAVCVVDDNPGCQGKYLRGVPIAGGREDIPRLVKEYQVAEIIIAIPSAGNESRKALLEICKETGCRIKLLPGMYQLINGDVSVSQLREVQIEDLLGREPISVNMAEILSYVQNQVILVTGGGGSIGSELCRQIAQHEPKQLIILDIYENNVYEVQQELLGKYPALELTVLIASVRNTARLEEIFREYRPDIVYHAAAHKHVPLMENSPNEAVKNNVFGTWKVAKAADKYGTKRFVLISTDKAVNPTNIMGASKRICEMIIQMMSRKSKAEFVAVRFGNVLGSNGSVVPLFRKQIEQGGPVTVTHPDIIRYFMTIPEAVSLVLQAGAYAEGGEIFVLDMGEPMKVLDLAKNMIKLSGYKVGEDIQIEFTGLRPGEKMYEELLLKEEGLKETANRLIYIGKPIEFDAGQFEQQLVQLERASEEEAANIRELVKGMVPTYCYEQ